MINSHQNFEITIDLAHHLIQKQFPEYVHLPISSVEKQGHDNRTFRLGNTMLIRMPTTQEYALKVSLEQELLPKLAQHLSVKIPKPIKMGYPSEDYPFPFSIYTWCDGISLNLFNLEDETYKQLAFDCALFLKELQNIKNVDGPMPGQHNWWRGDHVSVYDKGFYDQIKKITGYIDINKATNLWESACKTKWNKSPVWVHGDFAIGNILVNKGILSAVIDFGGLAVGDPACDLVIAWTYFTGNARDIFIKEMHLDDDTWLRAKAWALWKATFELCLLENKECVEALKQIRIIEDVLR